MGVQSYRNLIVWQKGVAMALAVYEATRDWPRDELYGITSQVRRAAVSIPANVAEGQGRSGPREYLHHVSIAHGSLCEMETHLIIAHNLYFVARGTLDSLAQQSAEVGRLLNGLMKSLR